ncbi:sigma-70 family RNA polymerase sigma factor [Paenibacillus sp. FJAT-26967]|uniref:sigma-70 family RNA polymerase sigma factor n=1 Tax=Paenibacillus sp. FJAT-26967 TaxID=1729690 RepID=UPI0008383F71|nr:sigma-70 family RNA polymerase sigma factor [Paenibacillus sp. FJAT-26967]
MGIPESDSFQTVFYEHYPSVRRKLLGLVRSEAAADDLAQDVFIKLYRNPPEDPASLGAWLHRVLTRTAYDYMDKLARERRLLNKQEQTYEAVSPPSGEETVLRNMDQQEVRDWLEELSERDRQVLLLRYSGYSYLEIAEELHVRPPLVGTMLNRATARLRQTAARVLAQKD